ncbi:arsenate reductase ArsC [Leptolinea tardivitalis]|uniref:Protein tyrosine phosphatase n=1 Tax=Leptolinea tardivitalis TaxID=229920 RepID=A0A0P6WUW7_9CHLR|nr:arsenate reductase ArsC [Leptolinea tardivitalis]KPL70395.1 protein tyrosine phosphatase [Leptolinea tardivitalis]GAP21964.1 protein tyrosine phosphatase [Leptolinea tardivitalis]
MINPKRKILFLCMGNSCRSQMAEAIVNARYGDQWDAVSAGTKPAGYVHPYAIKALQEIGIEHKGTSKSIDQFRGIDFDLVVTVCDDAAENCPVWLGKGKRKHVGFPDPAKAQGTEDEILGVFRTIRDDMLIRLEVLLKESDHK